MKTLALICAWLIASYFWAWLTWEVYPDGWRHAYFGFMGGLCLYACLSWFSYYVIVENRLPWEPKP